MQNAIRHIDEDQQDGYTAQDERDLAEQEALVAFRRLDASQRKAVLDRLETFDAADYGMYHETPSNLPF